MNNEKFTNKDKKLIKKMNLHGEGVDAFAEYSEVCPSTVYKAISEGELLIQIDDLKRSNREKDVKISLLEHENMLLKKQRSPQPLVHFLN